MVDTFDVYELVRELFYLRNKDYDYAREDADNLEESTLEEFLYDSYGFEDFGSFVKFIDDLMELTPVLKSPLTGSLHHVLGIQEGDLFTAIIKKEYKNEK